MLLGLLATLGCAEESSPEGAEGTGLGPTQEAGAPCEATLGCTNGLFCDEGVCAPCGTGVTAPGKLCFGARTLVAERSGRLEPVHLSEGDALLVDNREVHVRVLFRDGTDSLREQWFGSTTERVEGEVLDIDGDGFDEFLYCSAYSIGVCQVLSFEEDALVPIAAVSGGSSQVDGVPSHGDLPGRIFSPNHARDRWDSWLVYPSGVVGAAPLPVFPTDSLLSGDLDGDAVPELAAPVDGNLAVLRLDETGIGYEVSATLTIPVDTTLLAVTDLDGDSRDELLLSTPSAELLIARYDPTSGVTISDSLQLGWPPLTLSVGDIDGDGRLDMLTRDVTSPPAENEPPDFDHIVVLAQTHPGVFERRSISYPHGVGSVVLFDVDRDGNQDLVVGGLDGIHQLLATP